MLKKFGVGVIVDIPAGHMHFDIEVPSGTTVSQLQSAIGASRIELVKQCTCQDEFFKTELTEKVSGDQALTSAIYKVYGISWQNSYNIVEKAKTLFKH